jgi:hypothetical protein
VLNNWGIWNERQMPNRVICRGDRAVMSRFSKNIEPLVGFR